MLVVACPASAALGGDASSVGRDLARMNGADNVGSTGRHTVHEILVPGGTVVREYVSAEGVVFAVTWSGPFRPDLRQLLGAYFDEFTDAAREAKSRHAGRAPLVIERPDLVVHMGGRSRAFVGRAFVPSLVPADVLLQDVR
jgi:hypothetical protein